MGWEFLVFVYIVGISSLYFCISVSAGYWIGGGRSCVAVHEVCSRQEAVWGRWENGIGCKEVGIAYSICHGQIVRGLIDCASKIEWTYVEW